MSASEGGKFPTVIKPGKTVDPWRVVCSGVSREIERLADPELNSKFRRTKGCGAELKVFNTHLFQHSVLSEDARIPHNAIFFECPLCETQCSLSHDGLLDPNRFPSYTAWKLYSQK